MNISLILAQLLEITPPLCGKAIFTLLQGFWVHLESFCLSRRIELGFMESVETQFEEILSRKPKALASKPRIFRLMPSIFPLVSPVL